MESSAVFSKSHGNAKTNIKSTLVYTTCRVINVVSHNNVSNIKVMDSFITEPRLQMNNADSSCGEWG